LGEPIFEAMERDLPRYHDLIARLPAARDTAITTAPDPGPGQHRPSGAGEDRNTEVPVSLISTLETDFADVRTRVEEFATSKLPAAVADAKALEGNPVVDALLAAAHVPVHALQMVVDLLNGLAAIYPRPADAQAAADPAAGQPEPAPAA